MIWAAEQMYMNTQSNLAKTKLYNVGPEVCKTHVITDWTYELLKNIFIVSSIIYHNKLKFGYV